MTTLRGKIAHEIRSSGPIPFSRYMELCLYDPEFGYYSRNAEQFGKAGDFYTSSDVHAVFGCLMARQFEEMWRGLGAPGKIAIVELGPGRGLFAQDVLAWSEKKFPDFFRALQYVLVESSPGLRKRIETTLAQHLASGKASLRSVEEDTATRLERLPDGPHRHGFTSEGAAFFSPARKRSAYPERRDNTGSTASLARTLDPSRDVPTIHFANEFFDALPVEILSSKGSLRIDVQNNRFVETWAPHAPGELEFLDRHSVHPEPEERLEIPLMAQQYMQEIAARVTRGFLVVIDYGYTRNEQLAGRHRGTLKAIRQHSVSLNPYESPGEQDITADVNFTALAAAAEQQGMQPHKLITQSQFLMGIGESSQFADAFEECCLPQERAKVALQLKHLVTPAGMGESFHVLVSSKGVEPDKLASLAGLSFGTQLLR